MFHIAHVVKLKPNGFQTLAQTAGRLPDGQGLHPGQDQVFAWAAQGSRLRTTLWTTSRSAPGGIRYGERVLFMYLMIAKL